MRRLLVAVAAAVSLAGCTSSSPTAPPVVPGVVPYSIDAVRWPSTGVGVAAIFRALPDRVAGHDRTDAGMLGPTTAVYGLFDPQDPQGDVAIAAWSLDDEVGPPPGAPVDQLRSLLGLPAAGREEFASVSPRTGLALVGAQIDAGTGTMQVVAWLVHDDPWVFTVSGRSEADREAAVGSVVAAARSASTAPAAPYGIGIVTWPGDPHSARSVLAGLPATLGDARATRSGDLVTYATPGEPSPTTTVRIVTAPRGEGPLEAIPAMTSLLPSDGGTDVTSISVDPTRPLAWILAEGRLDAGGRWTPADGSIVLAWASPESQVVYVVTATPAATLDPVVSSLLVAAEAAGR